MNRPNLVVTRHSLLRSRVLFGGAAFAVLAAGWFLYELGMSQAGFSRMESLSLQAELEAENRELRARNKELSERVAALEVATTVDREAYSKVEGELVVLQARIQEQQEDIEFYKGIVNENEASGLRIQDFEIIKGFGEREYDVRLVLAQAFRSDRQVSGEIDLIVEGVQSGQPARLGLAELATEEGAEKSLRYSFRYFQDLKRALMLPEGFEPDRVQIIVRPAGKSSKTVEEFFIWEAKTG